MGGLLLADLVIPGIFSKQEKAAPPYCETASFVNGGVSSTA
jgi:hypothetical protein